MDRYFMAFRFKSSMQNIYWLPMTVEAENKSDASNYMATFQAALCDRYELLEFDGPELTDKVHGTPPLLKNHLINMSKGKFVFINIAECDLSEIEGAPELVSSENWVLDHIYMNDYIKDETVARIKNMKIPVRIRSDDRLSSKDEMLAIEVVKQGW